jgi:hypothetical protein
MVWGLKLLIWGCLNRSAESAALARSEGATQRNATAPGNSYSPPRTISFQGR